MLLYKKWNLSPSGAGRPPNRGGRREEVSHLSLLSLPPSLPNSNRSTPGAESDQKPHQGGRRAWFHPPGEESGHERVNWRCSGASPSPDAPVSVTGHPSRWVLGGCRGWRRGRLLSSLPSSQLRPCFIPLCSPKTREGKKSPKMPLQFQATVYHHHTHTYHIRVSLLNRKRN